MTPRLVIDRCLAYIGFDKVLILSICGASVHSQSLLTINLPAIVANWRLLNDTVGDRCCCASVVKADAYGLGVKPVAQALYAGGCRSFFVATLNEGVELREYLDYKDCEIFVFGGLAYDVVANGCSSAWLNSRLTPVLFSLDHVVRWECFTQAVGVLLPCVLKLDTGMHRTGLLADDLDTLLATGAIAKLNLRYLMSHFACADEPSHEMNTRQLTILDSFVEKVQGLSPKCLISVCNSPGIFLPSRPHYDMVRPGIALYGGNPSGLPESAMKPVVTLLLAVMQVKAIKKGESVGYGASYITQKDRLIAITSGGYADGIARSLSNIGVGYCGSQAVPIIGRVSMDSLVFDITHVVGRCDRIILLGECQTIDELAESAGTIGYEVLTSLGSRFQREYIPFIPD
ncbi:alanine racemase [Eionea flava]